jgi:hypothetical protein
VAPGRASNRIPLVPNARRVDRGHRIRLVPASDDNAEGLPYMMRFRHPPVGDAAIDTVGSLSRLLLPVLR